MARSLQMQSLLRSDGTLELSLAEVEVPAPGADEVLVRIEAAPINPSDLGPMLGPADVATATAGGTGDRPVITAQAPPEALARVAARVDAPMVPGNEGAGVVVDAGSSGAAQALLGRTVGVFGGSMYTQVRCLSAEACLPLPEGTTPAAGASCFVNPLTALGMVETMRREHHAGLVHTAAASNLGQMLNRLCLRDGVPLVSIVRRAAHVALLRDQGATHVCDSTASSFLDDLTEAIADAGATLAFDAIGGGRIGSDILTCMERAASRGATRYSGYGSSTHKQLYIYGGLDGAPTELHRAYGMVWGVGGWLLPAFLQRVGPETLGAMRARVAREITTTFASHYTKELSLAEALQLDALRTYHRKSTGGKYLINPNKVP